MEIGKLFRANETIPNDDAGGQKWWTQDVWQFENRVRA